MNFDRVKELLEKTKVFIIKHKYYVAGGAVALLFMGGVGLALNQPKVVKNNDTLVVSSTTKATDKKEATTKSSEEMVAESKVESLLAVEPKADTNVEELEKQVASVKDETVKKQLVQKLATVKQEVVKKQQEQPQAQPNQVVQVQQSKKDEISQNVQQPQAPTPVQTTQRQPQVSAPQRPVETTRTTTQKPVETTQQTTKKYRKNSLGNSGMEFATAKEAGAWAYQQQLENGKAYLVWTVLYSDGTKTYTVQWK